ncbi:MAG: hypothetical protein IH968_05880 [Gemmatimonadetes bacterium]|nr:hypothetical protein [Gemmatimonadota bacterium]
MNSTTINRQEWADEFLAKQAKPLRAAYDYIPTFLPSWNSQCRDDGGGEGLGMGQHLAVAGGPGFGKTLFATNLGCHATAHGVGVGYMNLEMSLIGLTRRAWAIATETDVRTLERGRHYDAPKAAEVAARVVGAGHEPFRVNTKRLRGIREIIDLMIYWRDYGTTLFIIDYMQLIGDPTARNSTDEVAKISAAICDFAALNEVVTVALTQFNRETSKNYQESPTIQGLYGGQSLEADADQVLMIDHSRYERVKDKGRDIGARTFIILGKNRHGGIGDIPVWMDYRSLRVREALPDEEAEWPHHPGGRR